jgi:hypothetical protein
VEIFRSLNHSPALRAALVNTGESMVASGKIGDVSLAQLGDRPPTAAEWKDIRGVIDTLGVAGSPGLPVGYACLGTSFMAPGPPAPSVETSVSTIGDVQSSLGKGALSGAWGACAADLRAAFTWPALPAWTMKVAGWVLTALAGTLGATYWFQVLSKAINIRDSGRKPARTVAPDVPAR